jgi:hypothetical protein
MARLIPKIHPSEIENSGERAVAEALLKTLPSRVDVFHSFSWLAGGSRGALQEGESDFVLVDPENGVLFIEVKGGRLFSDPQSGEWVRELATGERRRLTRSPFQQAAHGMHEWIERMSRQPAFRPDGVPFTYGFAVAFPDCSYTGTLPPEITPKLLLDAGKVRDIAPHIEDVFSSFRRRAHRPMDAKQVEAVHATLFPKFDVTPVLWRKVEDQEERLRRLTVEQQALLQFLGGHRKAAIRGVAGSGKTILALAKAQAMAREGARTLLLCYNKPLKDWLVEATAPDDSLVIDTFHGLASDLCRAAGIDFRPPGRGADGFWRDTAPELLMQATEVLGREHKFCAVVVDEGQDFHELWWTSLDSVFLDRQAPACYYVFFDPKQNLYVEQPSLPLDLGVPYDLPVNCRNTVRIAEHCARLVDAPPKTKEGAPIGDEPIVTVAGSATAALKEARRLVSAWTRPVTGQLKPSQIAILAPQLADLEWPSEMGNVALTSAFEKWRRNEGVLISTWSRFKGLEADAIVVIESAGDGLTDNVAHRYVARSRAKHVLHIIEVRPGQAQQAGA